MKYFLTSTLIILSTLALSAAHDEVRFKPRNYTPNKSAPAKNYTPAKTTPAARPLQSRQHQPKAEKSGGFWSFFKSKPAAEAKHADQGKVANSQPYKQGKPIKVPTIKADTTPLERKPYESSQKTPAATPYRKSDKPRERDPLLEPKQGIKLPQ